MILFYTDNYIYGMLYSICGWLFCSIYPLGWFFYNLIIINKYLLNCLNLLYINIYVCIKYIILLYYYINGIIIIINIININIIIINKNFIIIINNIEYLLFNIILINNGGLLPIKIC